MGAWWKALDRGSPSQSAASQCLQASFLFRGCCQLKTDDCVTIIRYFSTKCLFGSGVKASLAGTSSEPLLPTIAARLVRSPWPGGRGQDANQVKYSVLMFAAESPAKVSGPSHSRTSGCSSATSWHPLSANFYVGVGYLLHSGIRAVGVFGAVAIIAVIIGVTLVIKICGVGASRPASDSTCSVVFRRVRCLACKAATPFSKVTGVSRQRDPCFHVNLPHSPLSREVSTPRGPGKHGHQPLQDPSLVLALGA